MKAMIEQSEVDEAAVAARRAIARLVDLTLSGDPELAEAAVSALVSLRYRIADAAMVAFPRARTRAGRDRLLQHLDETSPPFHTEAREFVERVAAGEPDEEVREYAEEVCRRMERRQDLESEFD